MLQTLHVKNLALFEDTLVEFEPGLNILTGETGAGKSLLLGSLNLALGGRFDKDMLRSGQESALVELSFTQNEKTAAKLREMDIDCNEDGTILLSRKIQENRSVCKINGETVTARQVKELAEELLDIHGQHEHQSLLKKAKHLEVLDAFAGEELTKPLAETASCYAQVRALEKELARETMDEQARAREQSLCEFEWKEIEEAAPKPGEDEELEAQYRKLEHGKRIQEALSRVYAGTSQEGEGGAGDSIGRSVRAMESVSGIDGRLDELCGQLAEIDGLLSDFNKDLSRYMAEMDLDEKSLYEARERLNLLNHLKDKYGRTIEDVLQYAADRKKRLETLQDYDAYLREKTRQYEEAQARLQAACDEVSGIRRKHAAVFAKQLKEALAELNFLSVEFEVKMEPAEKATAGGKDDVEFLISVNPGESVKPLSQVASGGELSRIMLAIKTMLAGKDEIETLIFDEIDAGISGRTAWKVSGRLHMAADKHQVICITHLPQIAAMADAHFAILKSAQHNVTTTDIVLLDKEGEERELARLLGSDELTDAALTNARELKLQADGLKNGN